MDIVELCGGHQFYEVQKKATHLVWLCGDYEILLGILESSGE